MQPLFKTTPIILPTPPILLEKSELPLPFFWKFQKLNPHLYKGRGVPTMLYLFQVKKVPFTAWKIAATLSL